MTRSMKSRAKKILLASSLALIAALSATGWACPQMLAQEATAQEQTTKAVFPAGADVTIGEPTDTTHKKMGWGSVTAFAKFYTTINQMFTDALKDTSVSPEDITKTTNKLIADMIATGEMTSFKCGTRARIMSSQALGKDDAVYVVKTDKGYWMVKAGSLVAASAPSKEELLGTRQGLNGGFTHQVDDGDYYLMNQGTNIVIHTSPGRCQQRPNTEPLSQSQLSHSAIT